MNEKLQRATLSDANLREAILTNADLREAILGDANLQGTRLGGTRLQGVEANKSTIWPKSFAVPEEVVMVQKSYNTFDPD